MAARLPPIFRTALAAFSSLAAFAALGCAPARAPASASAPSAAAAPSVASAPPPRRPIRFIEDDYPRALVEARASHKPIFIDAWATWCHTCLSMRAYVFPDPALDAFSDKLVWLSIDTEKPENARFVETHPMNAWPTLWVIDENERVALKWSNSATASELGSLLEDATLAMKRGDRGMDAGAALVRGNQANAEGKSAEAIRAYREALALAPRDWPKRANVVESLVSRLEASGDAAACAQTAADEIPRIAGGTSRVTAAIVGLECAAQATGDAGRARKARLFEEVRTMAYDPREPVLADDRSGLFGALVESLRADKRDAEAHDVAAAWATFLEGEAKRAPTPAARITFDPHRLDAYLELGEPERAVPMLEASEHDFPADYNPPFRLARALLAMHRYPEALSTVDRALTRAYGPRRLRVHALKADILEARGDRAAAAAALRTAIAESKTMALTGGQPKLVQTLETRAKALEASSAK